LHVIAGSREGLRDKTPAPAAQGSDPYAGWIALGTLDRITRDLPDGRALVVTPEEGERIAVFRKEDQLGAISHACAHQNGPLGEGRIVFGCVTCPWHGFQYRLEDGCAPPPFTEKVPTYTMVVDETGQLWLDPTPLPAGTARPLTDLPKQEALHGSDTVPA
ncbi:MAG: Rieske (2Fe-2S) protein, partial [Rhodospirillaceae bacterium]